MRIFQLYPIEREEREHDVCPDTLVPIDECMILYEPISEPGCLRQKGRIRVIAPKRLEGGVEGGLQEPFVPQTIAPSRLADDILMHRKHLIFRKADHLASVS